MEQKEVNLVNIYKKDGELRSMVCALKSQAAVHAHPKRIRWEKTILLGSQNILYIFCCEMSM